MQTKNAETQMNRITQIARNLSSKFICLQTYPLFKVAEIYRSRDARFLPRSGVVASLQVYPEKTDAGKNQKIREIPQSVQSVMQTKKEGTNPYEINPAVSFSG